MYKPFHPLIKMAISDFRLIFRDPTLWLFLLLPVLLNLMVVYLLPYVFNKFPVLNPYVSVFLNIALIENTMVFCIISTLVLIEEKETGTARVYATLPVTKSLLILSRLALPYLLTVVINFITLNLQKFYPLTLSAQLQAALLTSLVMPVYVLLVSSHAKNRIEAMVFIKLYNFLVLLPVAAFFITTNFRHGFGLLPTHWLLQSNEVIYTAQSNPVFYMIYLAFMMVLLWWSGRRFIQSHFQ